MHKCIVCGNNIKKENLYCPVCLSDKESKKEIILRKIHECYQSFSLGLFPLVCFVIICDIKNINLFIQSDDFILLIMLVASFISSCYYEIYETKYKKSLQYKYKNEKSKKL